MRSSLLDDPICIGIVCIVVDSTRPRDRSRCPTLPASRYGLPRHVTFRSVLRHLVRVSKDRPFTVSGAEESTPTCTSPCLLRRPVANRSRVPSSWFSTTLTAYSSSTLSGYCTGVPVMGFVAFRAARRCLPRHEVLPFEAFLLTCSGLPLDGGPSWRRACVTHRASPLVHRLPCPLVLVAWTSRRCSTCEAVSRAVLPPRCCHLTSSLLPWACPDSCAGVLSDPPRSSTLVEYLGPRRLAPTRSQQVRMNVKDRREAQSVSRPMCSVQVRSRSPFQHRLRRLWRGGSPQPLPPPVTLAGT